MIKTISERLLCLLRTLRILAYFAGMLQALAAEEVLQVMLFLSSLELVVVIRRWTLKVDFFVSLR